MRYDITELTNEGKRNLLRMLCDELTYEQINRLVEPYARRLMLDEMGEPFIVIDASENELERNQILWIDINDIVTETITDD